MGILRSQKMYDKYKKYKQTRHFTHDCPLCDHAPLIKDFKKWKIVKNIFPWDKIAKSQHMLVPKRHVTYKELNQIEKKEYDQIRLNYLEHNYDIISEAMHKTKSIPEHYHLHLIVLKK